MSFAPLVLWCVKMFNNVNLDSVVARDQPTNVSRDGIVSREVVEKDEEIMRIQAKFQQNEADWNSYATSKSVSQTFLNTTSITSQISLLVILLASVDETGKNLNGFQIALVVLISLSLALQFLIFVFLVILAKSKEEKIGRSCTATGMNSLVTSLTGLLLIISSAITAVSLKANVGLNDSSSQ